MKNIYFATFALALFAFSACSTGGNGDGDSSDSGGFGGRSSGSTGSKSGACYFTFTLMEDYGDMCTEGRKESLTNSDVEFMNSCPSGQDYKCYIGEDDEGAGYMYFYGSQFDENSCREYGGIDVPNTGSRPSSSSRPSSNSNSTSGVCYFPDLDLDVSIGMCLEGKTASITRSECEEAGEEQGLVPIFQNSCPSSSPQLKCDMRNGYYVYYYGAILASLDCSDFGYNPVSSSSSKPSSSSRASSTPSSNSNSTAGACYFTYNGDYFDWSFCLEYKTESITRTDCDEIGETISGFTPSFKTSCPTGYRYTCDSDDPYIYFYGEDAEESDCDFLLE